MEFNNVDITNNQLSGAHINEQIDIISQFFHQHSSRDLNLYQSLALDLYRAIVCYRLYKNVDNFVILNPEFESCKEEISELWSEFSFMTESELSDVCIKILKDL